MERSDCPLTSPIERETMPNPNLFQELLVSHCDYTNPSLSGRLREEFCIAQVSHNTAVY